MMHDEVHRRWLAIRLLAGTALSVPIVASVTKEADAANILFENTLYLSGASGATTKRTPAQRAVDVLNLKDFGAIGNGVADDAPALKLAMQSAFSTSSPSASGASLFAPPGSYLLGSQIDFGALGGNGRGRFFGAGKGATSFIGTINNNFLFTCKNGDNAFHEISDMSISNFSTVPGTGALRWIPTTPSSSLRNIDFGGMIGLDMTFNSFHPNVFSCQFSPPATLAAGSVAVVTNSASLIGCRWHDYEMGLMVGGNGANGLVAYDTSAEENGIGYLLGVFQGWSSSCTIAPEGGNPGFSILTVGGEISPANTGGASQPSFVRFYSLYGAGLTSTWATPLGGVQITDDHNSDGTLTGVGFAGTYRVAGTITISSPVPMMTRAQYQIAGADISGGETEGCYHGLYVFSAVDSSIRNFQFTGVVGEAAGPTGEKTLTAHSHIYISNAGEFKMEAVRGGVGTFTSSIFFETTAGTNGVTLENCNGIATPDSVTAATTTIATNIMTVVAMGGGNQGTIGQGMTVTGAGIPGGTTIIATALTDGTLTGAGAAGTYKLSASIGPLGPITVTVVGGVGWTLPTSSSNARAGLQLNNCVGQSTPAITFTELPGQAGNGGATGGPFEGQTFDITDCNTATFLATAAAGGSGATAHRRVRYNASSAVWQVVG